ncbi:MAG: type II toxin-antitoxin system ParD family antitoxin [Pseudomonadota bacterium]
MGFASGSAMSQIDLSDDIVLLAQAQVAAGRAASVEDVLRAGVSALERSAERERQKMETLRAAIDEGDASGIAEDGVFDRVRERAGLPRAPR